MKKLTALLLVILIFSSMLFGCGNKAESETSSTSVSQTSESKAESKEEDTVSKTPESKPESKPESEVSKAENEVSEAESKTESVSESVSETESASESEKEFESYIVKIPFVGSYIFSEPDYDSTVNEPMPVGSFTIVEEVVDRDNKVWGKLKSGAGYICLSDIPLDAPAVSIGEADKELLKSGSFISFGESTGYSRPVVIQVNEKVTKLSLSYLEITDGEIYAGDSYCYMEESGAGEFIVVWVSFPGDMSTYGVSVTDENGILRQYLITESGRNGTIEVTEYEE